MICKGKRRVRPPPTTRTCQLKLSAWEGEGLCVCVCVPKMKKELSLHVMHFPLPLLLPLLTRHLMQFTTIQGLFFEFFLIAFLFSSIYAHKNRTGRLAWTFCFLSMSTMPPLRRMSVKKGTEMARVWTRPSRSWPLLMGFDPTSHLPNPEQPSNSCTINSWSRSIILIFSNLRTIFVTFRVRIFTAQ